MKNTLLIRTAASHSLNFMITTQNIYLNQKQESRELKFPYIRTSGEFRKDFEEQYVTLWDELTNQVSEHQMNDSKVFAEEKKLFYQRLFVEND